MIRLVKTAAVVVGLVVGAGWTAWAGVAREAWGLAPDQIAVIVNSNSPGSKEVADFYAKARQIPADHFINVSLEVGENISEADYQKKLVGPVRQYLADHKLDMKVTCLVTTYDVPLRVGAKIPTEAEKKVIDVAHKELAAAMASMQSALAEYDAVLPAGGAKAAPGPADAQAVKTDQDTFAALMLQLHKKVGDAEQRLNTAPRGPERTAALAKFKDLQERILGWAGTTAAIQIEAGGTDGAAGAKIRELVTRVQQAEGQIGTMRAAAHELAGHEKIVELVRAARGQAAEAAWLQNQIGELQEIDSEAAVDNELTLLWVDQYRRAGWIINPQSLTNWINLPDHTALPHLLMVSRLDGATPQGVIDMMLTTLRTEAKGLDGVIYLDARGLHGTDPHAVFDNDLRTASKYLTDNTNMKVVLDDNPALLETKDCPNAALYCGWYSLRSYQDSCQWLPGAVGYHVASLEMVSLHNKGETGWTVNLLKRGFCGTLGAVSEPYLHSFPQPSLFFPLLLSGEYTQSEVYMMTCPLLSWRIAWVGDPLYNPFKAKPRITAEQLRAHPILRHAGEILPPAEVGPPSSK